MKCPVCCLEMEAQEEAYTIYDADDNNIGSSYYCSQCNVIKISPIGTRPKLLEEVSIDRLQRMGEFYIVDLESGNINYDDNTYVNDIYRIALEAIYGEDVFKYIDSKLQQ